MSPSNLDPLITFPDGSHLAMSTQCSREGEFSCVLYTAIIAPDDSASFQMVSSHPRSINLSQRI